MTRAGITVAVLWLLGVLQVAAIAWLPTPFSGLNPVAIAVFAVAYASGPLIGAAIGAGAGLGLDLIPPASGPVGAWVLVLTLLGAAVGRISAAGRPGPFAAMALVGGACIAAVGGRALVLWFAGETAPVMTAATVALIAGACGVLLAPAALPLALKLAAPPPERDVLAP